MLLFWDEDIAFLGHTKWSTKHSGNNQRGTVKDTRSQVLEAVNIPAPVPLLSQALFTQCLPVECIVFSFFLIYSDTHRSLSTQWRRIQQEQHGSHFEYSLMECTHVLSPMMPDKYGIDEDFYSFTHHSTWSAIPTYTAARERTCKFISMPFACNGCLSKLCHDGCAGRESGNQTEMH